MLYCVSWLNGIPPRLELFGNSLKNAGYKVMYITLFESSIQDGIFRNDKHYISLSRLYSYRKSFQRFFATRWVSSILLLAIYINYIIRVRHQLNKLASTNDIILLTHPFLLFTFLRSAKSRCLLWYDVIEFWGLLFKSKLLRLIFTGLYNFIESIFLNRFDLVTCIDSNEDWLKNRLLKYNSNTFAIWNLPSINQSTNLCLLENLKDKYRDKEIIIYIGGLKPQKGLEIFPKVVKGVVKYHHQAHFIIIGSISTHSTADFWIKNHSIANHCSYFPWVSPALLYTYISIASIGLILSIPKGYLNHVGPGSGRKLFTYMSAGLPVIAPRSPKSWGIVKENGIGICADTENPASVINAINMILSNKTMLKSMSKTSRELFEQHFNWENQENDYIEFIKKECRFRVSQRLAE